jgi:anti-sigma-K factor RskA
MNAHPIREEDFDLYALGALEGDERVALESHLAECMQCASKLSEARGRIAMLALAAPRVEPSPAVKQRLMAQVRAEAEARASASVAPAGSRALQSREHASGLFDRWRIAILVPAFALLAIATIWLWSQNRKLDNDLAYLHLQMKVQKSLAQEAQDVASLVESRDTVTVPLAQQPGMPAGSARVMYNAKMGMLMYEGEIAPPPPAKSYQLWVVPADGKPISAGVFTGRPDHWMMKMPPGVEPREFAVSLEPAGGMPQPTGPMVLIGRA